MARHFDAIVIGSGLGGLTAGAIGRLHPSRRPFTKWHTSESAM